MRHLLLVLALLACARGAECRIRTFSADTQYFKAVPPAATLNFTVSGVKPANQSNAAQILVLAIATFVPPKQTAPSIVIQVHNSRSSFVQALAPQTMNLIRAETSACSTCWRRNRRIDSG